MMPILKIVEVIGTNVSWIPPYCWQTTFEFIDYMYTLVVGAEYDFNKFLISYLFTQMGYALTYRRIITKIEENNEQQSFEANMALYGQILN